MLEIMPIHEAALVCRLTPPATLEKQRKLWALADLVRALDGVQEVVVGMNNITAFAAYTLDLAHLEQQILHCWQHATAAQQGQGRLVKIPVHYGGEFGEDLAAVARYHGVTVEEIVAQHTQPIYTVYMIGFQPGFPYLGGLPESLHTPRHATPRTQVAAGSVGIGGSQTGVYPFASPGGWQLIGRTSLALFDATKSEPTLLRAGDNVQFVMESLTR